MIGNVENKSNHYCFFIVINCFPLLQVIINHKYDSYFIAFVIITMLALSTQNVTVSSSSVLNMSNFICFLTCVLALINLYIRIQKNLIDGLYLDIIKK